MSSKGELFWRCQEIGKLSDFIGNIREHEANCKSTCEAAPEAPNSPASTAAEQAEHQPVVTVKTLAQIMAYLSDYIPHLNELYQVSGNAESTKAEKSKKNTVRNLTEEKNARTSLHLKRQETPLKLQTQDKQTAWGIEQPQSCWQQQLEQYYWGGDFFQAYALGTAWQIQIANTENPHPTGQQNADTTTSEQPKNGPCSTSGSSNIHHPTTGSAACEHNLGPRHSPAIAHTPIRSINHAWEKLCEDAICLNTKDDPATLPHQVQLPLAFGSFAFDSTRGGWLKIPAVALIVSEKRVFLYSASINRDSSQAALHTGTANADAALAASIQTAKQQANTTVQYQNTGENWKATKIPAVPQNHTMPQTPASQQTSQPSNQSLTATQWQAAAELAIQIINDSENEIEKIVLAREQIVTASENIDSLSVLAELETQYQNCWRYRLGDLIGASPEMLAQIIDGQLLCRVLAGTCVKGEETALLASDKEQQEHAYAVESAYQSLNTLLPDIEKPATPFLLRLPNLSHLATDLIGKNPRISSLEAIAALHPTAAVCGTPKAKVQQLIPKLEKIDRGHYAGPIGWVDSHGQGEWAIALRCAQILNEQQYRLLAGAGIVADSVPEKEYAETNTKMYPLLNAIKQAEYKHQQNREN